MTPARYLACIILVAAGCLVGARVFADRMGMAFLEGGYPIIVAKRMLVDSCEFGEIVVLGDSRGEASIIPQKLPLRSANLALGAIGPVESYFIARKLLECPKRPQYVLYTPSLAGYQSLGAGLWQRAAKFGMLSYGDLRSIARVTATLRDPSFDKIDTGDGLTGVTRDIAYSYGFPSIFTISALHARFFGRYQSNLQLLAAVRASRGHVVYPDGPGTPIVGVDAKLDHFDPEPIERYYLRATLDLLSHAGIHTIILAVPVAEATRAALRPDVVAGAIQYVKEETRNLPNVTDTFTTLEGWPDRLFVDGSHMNAAGANLFSDELAICVRTWLADASAPCAMPVPGAK